ncbi:hypothetical protein VTL71DRAFT_3687 [Oculimacula yallundae]|uniref:Uncharacterized protein n=1 Tax=Oculimacula yallundae TaxID=86028 RepID=A0ABR4C3R6_9HELO
MGVKDSNPVWEIVIRYSMVHSDGKFSQCSRLVGVRVPEECSSLEGEGKVQQACSNLNPETMRTGPGPA